MSITVNLHTHTLFSDGELSPESLAANLAHAGARYVALTDHDTLEGLPRFEEALKKRGLACLPGVELTTWFSPQGEDSERELHLLGYGFDPQHPDLLATLASMRQARELEVQSIAGSLRKKGANNPQDTPAINAAPTGRLETGAAIHLLHRAGGKAFLAHPLIYETDPTRLEALLLELKTLGLDGLEALYEPFPETERARLLELAHKHELLASAGTDAHTINNAYAIEMPRAEWMRFREAVFTGPALAGLTPRTENNAPGSHALPPPAGKPHHFRRRSYILRIFLPTLIAIGLFLAAIWGIILPSFEQTLLDRKRELIQELTNSAWSILASYQRDEQNGLLTREEAQRLAAARIESLRYGPEGKDYFWIQDLQPRMVMHPYRPDLNGQDLSTFTDPRGAPIFVEFASLAQRKGEGYIDYVWQWKDDPDRLESKESYVRGFAPWGWVIGTGIYTDDVRSEILRIERSLVSAALVISGAVVLLLAFVLQQSLRIERERQEVLDSLRDSTERYHSLVEATTEGTLLIVDERCRYANPTFLGMAGYSARQLEFLDLHDLFPLEENPLLWAQVEESAASLSDTRIGEAFEGILRPRAGTALECVLTLSPILFAGQSGLILLCRDVARQAALRGDEALAQAARNAPVGIFRAKVPEAQRSGKAARRAALLEFNPAARAFFSLESQPALADLFSDSTEYETLLQNLTNASLNSLPKSTEQAINDAKAVTHILHLETPDAATRFVALTARLVRESDQTTIVGTLQDVTAQRRQETAREALIEKLQASLLFLHEPISKLGRDALVCDMRTPISELARQMTGRGVTAALVASGETIIGIVTDHDLRARVLAGNTPLETPIHAIMSAPLTKILEDALIYEALMRMEERSVRHLAVEDRNGQVVSVIDSKSLIQFQRYGSLVLSREISRAASVEEVIRHAGRAHPLVKTLLDCSARPRHVTHMLASICDSTTERLVQLAIEELGPPPTPFAFIAMGSQGRQEQTLVTDQDNGIIYAPADGSQSPDQINEYFLRLGKRICGGLHRSGYPLCRGEVMAGNQRWCRSLPDWISGFEEWIQKSTPQEIMEVSIFFDFRTVYGETNLTHELRRAIHARLEDQPAFFHHFAQNALTFKPPFRLLGNIYLGGGATEHTGEINLKDAMMPIVSFARLYALRHQINQTHTLERIEALTERGIILPASRDEIAAAYDFLIQLRLQTQVTGIQAGHAPTNLVHPGKLGYIQQEMLKQAFAQIAAVQKKIGYDFLGGV